MEAELNPYTPGAGTSPRALVGRDRELEYMRVLLARLGLGMPERSLVLTGLRGAGKTVLLRRMEHMAREAGWLSVWLEARPQVDLLDRLAAAAQSMLLALDRGARTRANLGRLANWLPTLRGTLSGDGAIGVEISPRTRTPAQLEDDVVELTSRLGAAARDSTTGVVLLIDELQQLGQPAMEALCAAMHRAAQEQTPIALAAAGLPNLPGLLADAKSYAERMFVYPIIGPLPDEAARAAIQQPLEGLEHDGKPVTVDEPALERMLAFAQGYPLLVQMIGKHAWNTAAKAAITARDVQRAEPTAYAELSESLFRVRWQRATPRQRDYLAALASLGGHAASGAVARRAGFKSSAAAAPRRDELIERGLIYSPEYGNVAFTVALFDSFVIQHSGHELAYRDTQRRAPGQDLGLQR